MMPGCASGDGAASSAGPMNLTVTEVAEIGPEIKSFTFAAADGSPLPAFIPGSHLVVRAGDHSNAYSLTSEGTNPTEYQISVLRVTHSRGGSRWMHDRLSVGDILSVQTPRSTFAPASRATKHLLVAGGIGITPIISHLRAAYRWGRKVQVLYAFRDGHAAHVVDVVELAGIAAELFNQQQEFSDRLTPVLAEQPIGTHLYVCGPAAMIDYVTTTAAELGWPDSRVHLERFGSDALDAGEPFSVTLTESGRVLQVPSGTSLLEALEQNGIAVPNRCRQGVCGECRIPVCGGDPVHRDLYLSDEEKKAGALMPCVSRAAKGSTLEVVL
jgi:ferredoxin-NADP reductase